MHHSLRLAIAPLVLVAAYACSANDLDPEQARSLDTETVIAQTGANPCGGNPCGENPCAKNACNPCAKNACNPCGGNPCNPCGGNPCGGAKIDPSRFKMPAGAELVSAPNSELVSEGEKIWNDRTLGKSGIACATCHYDSYGQMSDTFDQEYPHYVKMPHQRAGVSEVSAAEMVNFCMLVPMQDEPLAWDSRELAALTAYVGRIQTGFEPGMGGTAGANPCNPCGANPCNPCGGNPCGANACNPCGGNPCGN